MLCCVCVCVCVCRGSLCAACEQPITGACVSALGKKFHPQHFVCSFCKKQVGAGAFKEHASQVFCLACHVRVHGVA